MFKWCGYVKLPHKLIDSAKDCPTLWDLFHCDLCGMSSSVDHRIHQYYRKQREAITFGYLFSMKLVSQSHRNLLTKYEVGNQLFKQYWDIADSNLKWQSDCCQTIHTLMSCFSVCEQLCVGLTNKNVCWQTSVGIIWTHSDHSLCKISLHAL